MNRNNNSTNSPSFQRSTSQQGSTPYPQNKNSGNNSKNAGPGRGRGKFYRNIWRKNVHRPASREKPISFGIDSQSSSNTDNNNSNNTDNASVAVAPTIRQPLISFSINSNDCDKSNYPSWKLYFPQENCNSDSATMRKIVAIEMHIKNNLYSYDLHMIKDCLWYTLDMKILASDKEFNKKWLNFNQDLCTNPEHTINCASIAMHQIILNNPALSQSRLTTSPLPQGNQIDFEHLQIIRARIRNHMPIVSVKSLKVNSFGQFVSVRGTIIRSSSSQILCYWLVFRCPNCNGEQVVRQPDGIMTAPTSCINKQCKNRSNFRQILESPFTQTVAFQTIRLQDSKKEMDPGNIPRSIEIELIEDLVDAACPGDDVTVTGILKVRAQEELNNRRAGSSGAHPSMYKMYIQGMSIMSNKNLLSEQIEFTEKDMEAIRAISNEPSTFRLLVHSLCPRIYGHEMAKAGLLLCLFGGTDNNENRRTESHILIVGDPGIGKSQMLQACASASPKGMFVCGNSSTSIGLTASIRCDKGNGGAMEAGALVLCDLGVCCIDEFDKMSTCHSALLEVMEQQTVSVAKAGAICTLPARTAVLTAANPNGGHYDKSRSVSENIRVGPALLSRFDLVFIVLDRPDVRLDSLLTSHINSIQKKSLTSRFATQSSSSSSSSRLSMHQHLSPSTNLSFGNNTIIADDSDLDKENYELREFLKLQSNERMDVLPHILMQKYIDYARKHVHPKLSRNASEELKTFYLELRCVKPGLDTIPVTIRQLEALIRLTQARARIELKSEATRRHALDIIEIFKHSLVDVFSTDCGTLQMTRNINGSGMSQAAQAKKLLEILKSILNNNIEKSVFHYDELKNIATQHGLHNNFDQLLDSINIQGFILKRGQNYYKLV